MIICRKCQRHHADDVGAGPCVCGADLRRDGIALLQNMGTSPFDDSNLDELPPLDEELPALDDHGSAQPPTSSPTAPVPPPPGAPPPAPATGPGAPLPSGQAAEDSATTLKGRKRRGRSVKPQAPAPPAGPAPAPSAPPTPAATPPDAPAASPVPDVPHVVSADAVTPNVAPAASEPQAPEPKRARSVNPRDLLAAREDADTPNVGDAPPPGAASGAATSPGTAATGEMEPTPPPPKPGERACPECFEPNPETRHFCINCGVTLPVIEAPEEDDEADEAQGAPKQGLLKRFKRGGRGRGAPGGGGMGGRAKGMAQHQAKRRGRRALPQGMQHQGQMVGSWAQRARAVGGGGRMKYTSGLSTKSKVKAGAGILVVLVAIVALAGPGRGRVMALVGRGDPEGVSPAEADLFGHRVVSFGEDGEGDQGDGAEGLTEGEGQEADDTGVEGEAADGEDPASGGGGEIAAFPAVAAIDEDTETGAGIPWDLEDPPTAGLILTLEEPMQVRQILIAPGLPDSVEDGPLVLRPKQIQVCSDTEQCAEVTFGDSTSLQKQTLDLGEDVSTLTMTVLDVHVPEHMTYEMAVIGEIRVD